MNKNFEFYKNLIENNHEAKEFHDKLWDLVIISAINTDQKLCYEKQIEIKLSSKKLPKQFKYIVINDQDKCKIGSGGSTLNIIKHLHGLYNNDIYQMKILLIHAGGYRFTLD